jgi:glycosyltransferase involved in cell wall biosynthesis
MTNPTLPSVSVGIPVYNGSDYIAEAIGSVLGQTFSDFELIVCDNCSTDNTAVIVRSFDDPRIRYIRNSENLGLVGNSNRCLELARGNYISILHHDDIMMPDNLKRKVRLLNEHSDVGLVHSNICIIDPLGKVVSQNIWARESRKDYVEKGMTIFHRLLRALPLGASIFIGAVLARRECYERLGGFSMELPHCSDSEMWMRISLFYNVACIGAPLVKYRVHPTSASSSWGDYTSLPYLKEHYVAAKMVFKKHPDHIPHAKKLKKLVFSSFGKQAMKRSCKASADGDFSSGKAYFREAFRMSPTIYNDIQCWKAMARLAAGPYGNKLYLALRNAFQ